MSKISVIWLLAFGARLMADPTYKFSEKCYDEKQGVVVFTEKLTNKLKLRLEKVGDKSTKEIEINEKSSTPIICGGDVVVSSYGSNKILLYDYELRQLSETETGKEAVPFYSSCSSDDTFLYVYIVRFSDKGESPTKLIYRYLHSPGKLTYDGSSGVGITGKIVEFKKSVFVVNEKSCELVHFENK